MGHTPKSDREVWNNFREGDDSSLSLIYSRYAKSLYRYGLKFTGNRDIIEDVVHDLFVDLIRNRKTIGETSNIQFYLLKSFRRKLVRQLRGEMRYSDGPSTETNFDVHYSAETGFISEETRDIRLKRLNEAVQQLSPRQKEAIYLKFQKELAYGEISELLGMGTEACRNLVYRAIKSLREFYSPDGNLPVLLLILKHSGYF
ncbi:MAG: sigma-70 family RNA polymerase sigma factor [Prolixibacteraceae bacterium]|jgi:RNA polymerase sigma factor (sigma-70 family)|nr:sigma-70 family RNA polymerase sigma factor [Prolixibacteraceae bacterium]